MYFIENNKNLHLVFLRICEYIIFTTIPIYNPDQYYHLQINLNIFKINLDRGATYLFPFSKFFDIDIADIQLDRTSKYFSSYLNKQNNIFSVLHLQRVLLDILPDRDAQVCSKERGGRERRPGVETMFFLPGNVSLACGNYFTAGKKA